MDKKEKFLREVCPNSMCGSQRCDGSDEWLEGCRLYKEYLNSEGGDDNE